MQDKVAAPTRPSVPRGPSVAAGAAALALPRRSCDGSQMITRLFDNPTLLLVLTMLMWACNAISGQLAVGHVTPYTLVLMRWVMVVAVMWVICGREVVEHWPVIRTRLGPVILMSIAGFTGFNTLFYVASVHTTGLNIGILQGSMPVLVMMGAFLVFRTRVTPLQMLGVATTLIGVAIVASRGDLEVLRTLAFNNGDVIMLIAIILYCAYTVSLAARPNVPAIPLFTVFAIIALIAALPLAAWEFFQADYQAPTLQGWAVTVFVAIFPSCLAQIFFLRANDLVGPNRAAVFTNLVPIFTAILAVLLLGEQFALYHALALALVIGGIMMTQRGARAA